MITITEADVEQAALDWLSTLGWQVTHDGELCRRHGMSEGTFYKWKTKYAGLTLNELKRLRSVEEENRRLKQIVAQQALDNWSLKELLAKNF